MPGEVTQDSALHHTRTGVPPDLTFGCDWGTSRWRSDVKGPGEAASRPLSVRSVEALPGTATGKIGRRELIKQFDS